MEVGNEVTTCGVVVVMEVTQPQVGVRTRARAMATVTEETDDNSGDVKRRKLSNKKLKSSSSTFVQTKTLDCEIHVRSLLKDKLNDSCDAAGSRRSSGAPAAACCSSTGTMEKLKVSDLEKSGTTPRCNLSESTPTSEVESSAMVTNNSCRTVIPAEKTPPEAELEEFFAAAQEGLNERFKNKYNYDIVNDIPLKGRFEWIQVINRKKNDDEDEEEY